MVEVIVPSRFDRLVNNDGTPTTLFSAYLETLTDNNNDNIDIVEPYYRSLAALAALRAEVEDLKIIHSINLIPVDDTLQKRIDDLQEELIGFVMGLINQKDLTGFLRNVVEDATPQLGGNLDTQIFTVDGRDISADGTKLDGIESGATQDQNAGEIRTLGFFDINNDGTGSGLDADLLDGNHATAFATSAQGTLADSALQNIVEDITPQLGGELDGQNVKIVNITAPTSNNDVAIKIYVDTGDALLFPKAGGTVTGIYDGNNTTDSTSITTGSIHTDGGLGVAKNVFVGGNIIVKAVGNRELQFIGPLSGLNAFIRTVLTGSGITFQSNNFGGSNFEDMLILNGVNLSATFPGQIIVDNTTDSTNTTTGSIHTDGGLGVVKNLHVGGAVFLNLPTSAGTAGSLWNDGGTVKVA